MSYLPEFVHRRPRSLGEAFEFLQGAALPYHGGTELLAVMRLGLLRPQELVDLKQLDELRRLERDGDHLVIGGGVTHQQLADADLLREHLPVMARVVETVGNMRVRASGTVGGNLVFAEPRSDVATALLALDASVVLRSAESSREVRLGDFVLGGYITALEPGELLTEVRVPLHAGQIATYRKFQTSERPTVGVAIVERSAGSGCRLAVGAVGERPEVFSADAIDDLDAEAIARQLDVIEDLSGAEDYKRHVTAVTIRRTIGDLVAETVA